MAPSIDFRFIVCSFIPGLGLFFFLFSAYYTFLSEFHNNVFVVICGIFILTLGLFIDLIRHFFETVIEWWRGWRGFWKYLPYLLPIFFIPLFKKHLPKDKIKDVWEIFTLNEKKEFIKCEENYFNYISQSQLGAYHIWEFTGNISLSIIIGFIVSMARNYNLQIIFKVLYDPSSVSEYLHRTLQALIIIAGASIILNCLTSYRWTKKILKCTGIQREINYFFTVFMLIAWVVVSCFASRYYQLFFWSH
jgi:hypothetical protein